MYLPMIANVIIIAILESFKYTSIGRLTKLFCINDAKDERD